MIKKVEIFLRKSITRAFLNVLSARKESSLSPVTEKSELIFVSLNRIGDALVATPLLKLLKEKTGCRITVLAGRNNHFVFKGVGVCDDIIIYEKEIFGLFKTIRKLNDNNYDYIIDLHDDVSTTVTLLIGLCKIGFKVGLEKENRKIYTHTIEKLNPARSHIVDRMLKIAELFNLSVEPETANVDYSSTPESYANVDRFISDNLKHDFLVGINISAGSDARFWGVERYKSLCEFFDRYKVSVVLISAGKDLHFADQISGGKEKIFCSPSFDEFAAMISKLDFLFTPDTAAVHLASAFEVPLFGLYARIGTTDMIWSPYKSDFEYVLIEEPDFQNLSFDPVIQKFKPFFEKHYSLKRNN